MPETKEPKHYAYGLFGTNIFKKHWFWFSPPFDVKDAAMVNFFSYEKVEAPGFYRKEGLTSIIDLARPLDEIEAKMRKTFIRKQIEKGERRGIAVRPDDNFKAFKKIYIRFRADKGLNKDRFSLFRHGLLFSAYHGNRMIAGGVFITNGRYMRAWVLSSLRQSQSAPEREMIGWANRMVIWEAIKYAHKTGHEAFDLGGISPDAKQKELVSLAEFKEAFGGRRQPCYYYHRVYSPWLKRWLHWRGFKNL